MKRLVATLAVAAVMAVAGLGGVVFRANTAHADDARDIVGVWEVEAVAPYAPHLFTFNADGTMFTTNPTNVQERADKPHGGTNDSLGMGVWRVVTTDNGTKYIVGTFEQLNAFADNHQPADKLSVSFKVVLTNNGNGFNGPAYATVGSGGDNSYLTGTRVVVDEATVSQLQYTPAP